jgi:plasmid stabilization system protein ParE
MAYQVVIRKRFQNKVIKLLTYLENEWSAKVSRAFSRKLTNHLELLAKKPFIGLPSEKIPGIRSCNVSKHNRFYYRVDKNKVIVINMYDTRINPKKNPY